MYPTKNKYSKNHEWVKIEGDVAIIGITDYAQEELGDIVFVELPEIGATFSKDESISTVESVKAVSDVFTPVSGTIESVNEILEDEPELINSDPHGKGWIVKMKDINIAEMDELMDASTYEEFIKTEAEK